MVYAVDAMLAVLGTADMHGSKHIQPRSAANYLPVHMICAQSAGQDAAASAALLVYGQTMPAI
jgi:hypothetical protein